MDVRQYAHIFKETLRQTCNLLATGQEVLAAKVVCDAFTRYDENFFKELERFVSASKIESLKSLVLAMQRGE